MQSAKNCGGCPSSGTESHNGCAELRTNPDICGQINSLMIPKYKRILLKLSGESLVGESSFGLDPKITNRCLNLAAQCKKLKIPITTFMMASDPYLKKFVTEFTETNNGNAFFASLDRLGAFIFKDFESGKRKTVY